MDKPVSLFILILLLSATTACDNKKEVINIAVASNFEPTIKKIIAAFKKKASNDNDLDINIIAGSSGMLANQIINGAPYDLFLSADHHKTESILKTKKSVATSATTYAIGQLALWLPQSKKSTGCLSQLNNDSLLAIANPKTAPYGKVASQIIKNNNINVKKTLHTANVAQAYLHTKDQLVDAGFVAYSLLTKEDKGCIELFDSIDLKQSMILLNDKAGHLFHFILSDPMQQLIKQSGYNVQN